MMTSGENRGSRVGLGGIGVGAKTLKISKTTKPKA